MKLSVLEQIPPVVYAAIAVSSSMLGVFLGVALSPWFSWINNALSDIGVYEQGIIAASFFNGGLILAGVTTILYSLSQYRKCSGSLGEKIGIRLVTAGGTALTAIGTFPETAPPFHFIASVLFFVLLPLAMWAFGVGLLSQNKSNYFGILSIGLPFISLINWGLPYYSGVAIPELIAAISFWIWIVVFTHYYRQKDRLMAL